MGRLIRHTLLGVAPAVVYLLSMYASRGALGVMASYAPDTALGFLFVASLLPTIVALVIRSRQGTGPAGNNDEGSDAPSTTSEVDRPMHPAALLTPFALLAVFLLWPVAWQVAACVPSWCEILTGDKVKIDTVGAADGHEAYVFVTARGWGNASRFQFERVDLRFVGGASPVELKVALPELTLVDPAPDGRRRFLSEQLLQKKMTDLIGSGKADADEYATGLWALIGSYVEQTALPRPRLRPFFRSGRSPRTGLTYEPKEEPIHLVAWLLTLPLLLALSWLLSRRYIRRASQPGGPPTSALGQGQAASDSK